MTSKSGCSFSKDLEVGESAYIHLFKIWTDEGTVNRGEDEAPKPIEVGFSFTDPVTHGSATGTTASAQPEEGGLRSARGTRGPHPGPVRALPSLRKAVEVCRGQAEVYAT